MFPFARRRRAQENDAVRPGRRIVGARKWMVRLSLVILAPVLFLGGCEGILRLWGYGFSTSFLVKTDSGHAYRANDKFTWRFGCHEVPDYFAIPVTKPAGTVRIFIFGESAAFGTPDPSFNFGRILEVMLRRNYPDVRFEIVNTAIMGINSHAILPIVQECAAQNPDLFIVYMGNNEAVGFCAPGSQSIGLIAHLSLIRGSLWLKSTRIGQFIDRIVHGSADKPAASQQDDELYRRSHVATDDPRRAAVCDNFRANLSDICQIARRAGVRTILSTVAVNLRDQPPFGSLHRANLTSDDAARWDAAYGEGKLAEGRGQYPQAIAQYEAAAKIDDHFAELHFRLARCCLASSQYEGARQHFQLARYWDALPFRADARLDEIVRELAGSGGPGVRLVDAERALADCKASEQHIPGEALFYEHVHLRFAGHYEVAKALFPAVSAAVAEVLGRPAGSAVQIASQKDCAAELALTPWDEFRLAVPFLELTAAPPFTDELEHDQRQQRAQHDIDELYRHLQPNLDPQAATTYHRALTTYQRAIAERPDDWHVRFRYGYLLQSLGNQEAAVQEWRKVLTLMPEHAAARAALEETAEPIGKPSAAAARDANGR
jgi:tetratricopeptide (TPR) repeat protein